MLELMLHLCWNWNKELKLSNIANTNIAVFFYECNIVSNLKACYLCRHIRTPHTEFALLPWPRNKRGHKL